MRKILIYILLFVSFISNAQLVTYYPNKRIFTGELELSANAIFDFKGTEVDSLIVDGDTLRMYIDNIQFKAIQNPGSGNEETDPIYNAEKDTILFENDTILVLATKTDIQNLQSQIDTLPNRTELNDSIQALESRANNNYMPKDTTISFYNRDSVADYIEDSNIVKVEVDPIFSNSLAAQITENDTTNWGQNSGDTMTANQMNDSLNYKMVYDGNDTLFMQFGENYSRPFQLTGHTTIIIDMTNAKEYATHAFSVYNINGIDTFSLATSDGSVLKWALADSFNRQANLVSTFILRKNGNLWSKNVLDDTITIDLVSPYLLSAAVGNINDSLIVMLMSEAINESYVPQTDLTFNEGSGTILSDTVYVNTDTIFNQLVRAVSPDSTLLISYAQGDTIFRDLAGNLLANFVDSSVINNVNDLPVSANLILFYDASLATNFQLSAEDSIITFYDQSGHNNHLSSDSYKPYYNEVNRYIEFNLCGGMYGTFDVTVNPKAISILIDGYNIDDNQVGTIFSLVQNGTDVLPYNTLECSYQDVGSNLLLQEIRGGLTNYLTSTETWTSRKRILFTSDNPGLYVYINNILGNSRTDNVNETTSTNDFLIGSRGTGVYWKGNIYRIMVWNKALTEEERLEVETYLTE